MSMMMFQGIFIRVKLAIPAIQMEVKTMRTEEMTTMTMMTYSDCIILPLNPKNLPFVR